MPRWGIAERVGFEKSRFRKLKVGNVYAKLMDRGSERKVPHIGTETRSKLLREAAVRNIGQWAGA